MTIQNNWFRIICDSLTYTCVRFHFDLNIAFFLASFQCAELGLQLTDHFPTVCSACFI